MSAAVDPDIEVLVDDHAEYEPGVVIAYLRHARVPNDPEVTDFLVVDDDAEPVRRSRRISSRPEAS